MTGNSSVSLDIFPSRGISVHVCIRCMCVCPYSYIERGHINPGSFLEPLAPDLEVLKCWSMARRASGIMERDVERDLGGFTGKKTP